MMQETLARVCRDEESIPCSYCGIPIEAGYLVWRELRDFEKQLCTDCAETRAIPCSDCGEPTGRNHRCFLCNYAAGRQHTIN